MDDKITNTAEMAPEPQERPREEEKPIKREKPPKKPGSVSRFFNQFGVGKYWEQMNEYFEYEEKMEKAAAGKEATKETAEGMRAAAEGEVGAVKARGAEIPQQLNEAAVRAGAGSAEAAPIVAKAQAEETKIEEEAEAAKSDLEEEIPVFLAEPESTGLPSAEEIIKASEAEKPAKAEKLPTWEESDEADVTKEAEVKAAAVKAEELPSAEEIIKAHEAERAVEAEKPAKAEKLPTWEESDEADVTREAKAKEMPPVWEEVEPYTFSAAERKKIEAGLLAPKISTGFRARLPELSGIMETVFFAKGEKQSRARIEKMVNNLAKVGEAYVAQKVAKEKMTPQDEKALKKWVAETKSAIKVLEGAPEEMKPAKVVELRKPVKKKMAKRRAA
jgi:hypothetical protein